MLLNPFAKLRQLETALREADDRARRMALTYESKIDLIETRTADIEARYANDGFSELGARPEAVDVLTARRGYLGTYTDLAGLTRRFSISKRLVNMHAEYCFGGGVEAPTVGDDPIDAALKRWWFEPTNQRALFNVEAQHRRSANLLVDGSVFLACVQGDAISPTLVRWIDPVQFVGVVTHPEDESQVLYYQRKYRPKVWNAAAGGWNDSLEEVTLYYPDIDNDGTTDDPYAGKFPVAVDKLGNPIQVLRFRLNALMSADQGQGIMRELMDFEINMLALMEDQLTVSAATAAYMNTAVVKGGAKQIAAAQSYLGQSGDNPTNAQPNAGDWTVHNEGVALNVNRAGTNAGDNRQNIRMVQMPMAALSGVALHYMGDPENANLATAQAMEGPVQKHFEAYQSYWTYIYARLAQKAMEDAGHDIRRNADYNLNVPMPELVIADLLDRLEAIGYMAERDWASRNQATREAWRAMGAADPTAETQEALESVEEDPDDELPTTEMSPPVPGVQNEPPPVPTAGDTEPK